ncbi:uncharacterized protein DS421_4g128830 [Arachis hypogaea]|nr:uncharacterized protein DS421_4g128830 [Arachis hypogaea]
MFARVKCIMFLFLLVVLQEQPLSIARKTAVVVKNTVEGNLNLTIHCKSKDDDLGPVILSPNQSYRFTFTPNILFRITLFFCTFRWTGSCHRFDIYKQERDDRLCDNPCGWIIKKGGPCRDILSSHECFSWNSDTCV